MPGRSHGVPRFGPQPALGLHVAEREIGVNGPIREHYLVTEFDAASESDLRTEVCWPVFRTAVGG